MDYFNILIVTSDNREELIEDLSESTLLEKIVKPYELSKTIFINGTTIYPNSISRIHIRKSSEKYKTISNNLYEREALNLFHMHRNEIIASPQVTYMDAFWKGEDVLDKYIQGPPGYKKIDIAKSDKSTMNITQSKRVFLVHGHNEEMKQSVARFLEKLDLELLILHEQPGKGRTIIEKFENYSDVCFTVVLLSADDLAFVKGDNHENSRFRARQNVILELGYFLGKLGRDKVAALYEDGQFIEIPSDYTGVEFISYSGSNDWKLKLAKELKESKLNIDLNKII